MRGRKSADQYSLCSDTKILQKYQSNKFSNTPQLSGVYPRNEELFNTKKIFITAIHLINRIKEKKNNTLISTDAGVHMTKFNPYS